MTKAKLEMELMAAVQRYRICNHCSLEQGLRAAVDALAKNGARVRSRRLYSKSEVLESLRARPDTRPNPRPRFARWMKDALLRRA